MERRIASLVLFGLTATTCTVSDQVPVSSATSLSELSSTSSSTISSMTGDTTVEVELPPLEVALYGSCPPESRVGEFAVEIQPDFTSVQGYVLDGVVPTNVPSEYRRIDSCAVMGTAALFCEPTCDVDQTCGFDGECLPYPINRSIGDVSVQGVGDQIELTRLANDFYNYAGAVPHPLVDSDSIVSLRTTGDTSQGAHTETVGVAVAGVDRLVSDGDTIFLSSGEALPISWVSQSNEHARISIRLNINNHGSSRNWIECIVDDTGAHEIPAQLVDELLTLGTSGFPSVRLSRQSVASVEIDAGCFELMVRSPVDLPVEVDGVVSCSSNDECPTGEACQIDLTCGA